MNLSVQITIDGNVRILTPVGIINFIRDNSDLLKECLDNIKKEKDSEKNKRGKKK